MTSHELAKILLAAPDLPVATHALNRTYMSAVDSICCGDLKVGILQTYGGEHIVIGNIGKKNINPPNWYVSSIIHGNDTPDEWPVIRSPFRA